MKRTRKSIKIIKRCILLVILGFPCATYGDYQTSAGMLASMQQYLNNIGTSKSIESINVSFLSQTWTSSFNANWPSSSSGSYASGMLLPPEAVLLAYTDTSNYVDRQIGKNLSSGSNPVISNQTEYDSLSALAVIIGAAINDYTPDSVPQLFKTRRNTLPVTKGDFIIYNVIYPLKRSASPFTTAITPKQLSCWENLAQAKNPIYRLIAAQVFPQIVENYAQWNSFYLTYANETDPDIAKIVITTLGNSGQKSLITTLQAIQTGQTSAGNTAVAQLAATKIRNLQNTGE